MRLQIRHFLAAALLLGSLAPTASATEVLVVDGDRLVPTEEPYSLPPSPPPPPPSAVLPERAAPVATASSRAAVGQALRKARAKGLISARQDGTYRLIYRRALSTRSRLRGARRRELSSVIATVNSIARRGRLTSSRLRPVFLQLERNTQFWRSKPFPRPTAKVRFRGTELLYEYYPGRGLRIQPLQNFFLASSRAAECDIPGLPCPRERLRRQLDTLIGLSVRRGGFRAWEYYFDFGGGRAPWISGMAQATGIQSLAFALKLGFLRDRHRTYSRFAYRSLGAYRRRAPVGVRARGYRGGVHYLQYSFAPRLYIINAFLQTLVGLYDFGKIGRSETATRRFRQADPEARRELPDYDTGSWTRYSRGGGESKFVYHVFTTKFALRLCRRTKARAYCKYGRRFAEYLERRGGPRLSRSPAR